MWMFSWIFIHFPVLIILSLSMWVLQDMKIYEVFPNLAKYESGEVFLIAFLCLYNSPELK